MSPISNRRCGQIAFVSSFLVYAAVGYWLQVRHGFIVGDALSRMQAAQAVLDSRQPHLAAIGFIFTPLTAIVNLPGVLLADVWPDLIRYGYATSLASALFMAGAVVQIFSIGTDRSLPRGYAIAITVLFAANPMIVFYGSNGMSEAPFIFFLVWTVRRLIRWMVDDDVHHLVAAGFIALSLAYLVRYDSVGAIAAIGILVAVTTFRRAPGPPRMRRALLDLILVSGPGFLAFVGWAIASWLITGNAFTQFSSQYGNAAIFEQSGGTGPDSFSAGVTYAAISATLLAPTLIPIAVWAGFLRWRRPNWSVLIVPLVVFGGVLAFQAYSYASGQTFGFLRFYIVAIPFAACLAMLAVPDGPLIAAKRPGRYAPGPVDLPTTRPARYAYTGVALVFAVCLPVAGWGMSQPRYAPQEYALATVLHPDPYDVSKQRSTENRIAATFSTERKLADYLDNLDLPEGSVITDTVYGFAVVVASRNSKTFVLPSDSDFVKLLNDPAAFGVKYLLAVPNTGRGVSDALNMRYPTLYETGAEVATLELEIPNDGDNQPVWRLYRVNDIVPEA
ncbi:glycosyltransferase family 39 protein [Mycolicibacterium sp. HK-90]|uniref:ArnT family glycosyltransferase n=1 Tax=Mycolicibacterium sp. HK-90 TaxID=3056937 RepID=UPI002658AEA4|nr:ABC transporter [Mycolicibacterium sp. HK-90]WKG04776.1 ABC transporter [Mycolicibacterium sp. HK-90]